MTSHWRPLARHRRTEPATRPPEAPIYDALALGWALSGRCVPGQHDMEWAELAGRPVWPDADPPRAAVAGHAPGEEFTHLSAWTVPAPAGRLPPSGAGVDPRVTGDR